MSRSFVNPERTIKAATALSKVMRESEAGVAKFVGYDTTDTPLFAMILVDGPEATKEIIDTISALEEKWDTETVRSHYPTGVFQWVRSWLPSFS